MSEKVSAVWPQQKGTHFSLLQIFAPNIFVWFATQVVVILLQGFINQDRLGILAI